MDFITRIEKMTKLSEEIRKLDVQRDHLRAQLADIELEEYGHAEALAKRKERRQKEMKRFGYYIQPGPWDADLDKYQETEYTFDLGDGYTGKLARTRDRTWNGYVTVPEGHWTGGQDDDYLDFWHEVPNYPPQEITYHADGTIGFDHSNYRDCMPNGFPRYASNDGWQGNRTGSKPFLTFEDVKAEVVELANYLKDATNNPKHVAEDKRE